ncbi:hypothetical protein HanRHA438_Chr02g0065861 [Helianthus annuus]|nr:hypothetical protein HanRHA438_Chr02g0065861 [Helianthus annuus]
MRGNLKNVCNHMIWEMSIISWLSKRHLRLPSLIRIICLRSLFTHTRYLMYAFSFNVASFFYA